MDQDGGTAAVDEGGLARNRSRREKKDRYGRKAALEHFREARSGQRPRYVIAEEHNIYEEVDEEEYSKIVRDRQDDDWIVDDGTGYVEDGREIFDDDPEAVATAGKKKSTTNAKTAKNPNIRPTDSKPKSIRSMFAAAAIKPKVQKEVSLEDDDILGDIMGELKKGDAGTQMIRPAPVKRLRQVEPVYLSAKINKVDSSGFSGRMHTGSAVYSKKSNSESHFGSALKTSRVDCCDSDISRKSPEKFSEHSVTKVPKKTPFQQRNNVPLSQQIQEFASPDLFESDQHSEVIEDFDSEMDTSAVCSEVDVSGIDFNDNFEQEVSENKLSGSSTGLVV